MTLILTPFPLRGKVGMGAGTMRTYVLRLPPPQPSTGRGGSKASQLKNQIDQRIPR
jgi:hypothetical protein